MPKIDYGSDQGRAYDEYLPDDLFEAVEPKQVEGAGVVWAVVCGVPLLVGIIAVVAAMWPA